MTLAHMRLPRRYHQLGQPPATHISLGVPLSPMNDWFGRPYASRSILPFESSGGIDGTSDAGFEAMTFSFSQERLLDLASACQIPGLDRLLEPVSGAFLADSPEVRQLRGYLTEILATRGRTLDRSAEEELGLTLLHAASSSTAREERSSPGLRHRALRQALELIETEDNEHLSIAGLCTRTGVSLRTLNRAFRERFGVGPKAYLIRQRLSRLRDALLRAPPERRIADLANEHGFWHLGQLARVYRQAFGELPSKTRYSGRAAASRRWA